MNFFGNISIFRGSLKQLLLTMCSIMLLSTFGTLHSCGTRPALQEGADVQARSTGVRNLLILMYHDVIPNPAPVGYKPAPDDVKLENLIRQLDWLVAQGYETVSLREVLDSYYSGISFSGKKVLLTFDDNYYGTWKHGLPELVKRNMKASVFAHTQYVRPDAEPVFYSSFNRPKASWAEIVQAETELGGGKLFRWESHTVSHRDLTKLSQEDVRAELADSKTKIEGEFRNRLGSGTYGKILAGNSDKFVTAAGNKRVTGLAYPLGGYDARVAQIAKEVGYGLGFEVGFAETFGQAAFALPRMGVGLRLETLSQFTNGIAAYINERQR
jgi:peptidoglycan/xylan/chitin deacetylase (PgdA/CDA1 family)